MGGRAAAGGGRTDAGLCVERCPAAAAVAAWMNQEPAKTAGGWQLPIRRESAAARTAAEAAVASCRSLRSRRASGLRPVGGARRPVCTAGWPVGRPRAEGTTRQELMAARGKVVVSLCSSGLAERRQVSQTSVHRQDLVADVRAGCAARRRFVRRASRDRLNGDLPPWEPVSKIPTLWPARHAARWRQPYLVLALRRLADNGDVCLVARVACHVDFRAPLGWRAAAAVRACPPQTIAGRSTHSVNRIAGKTEAHAACARRHIAGQAAEVQRQHLRCI